MSYVSKLLVRDERIVRIARDHWIALLPTTLIDVAVSIVIVGLSVAGVILSSSSWPWFGFSLLTVPVVHLALRVWMWWNNQYIITNRRIIQITGTVNTRVSDTLLEKVNDIVMEQSALGRLLRFGTVEIITGSESGIDVFQRIADPIEFKKVLLDQEGALAGLTVFEEREKRVPSSEAIGAGDIPGLIAGLDELRRKGLLTDAEFEEKKQQLLAKI